MLRYLPLVLLACAVAGPVIPVAHASPVQGSAVTISGLDDLSATVDNQMKKGAGKIIAMVLGMAGLATTLSGRIGLGLSGVGAGMAMGFVPTIINSTFDSAPASTGLLTSPGLVEAWWHPFTAGLYPPLVLLKFAQDPVPGWPSPASSVSCTCGATHINLVGSWDNLGARRSPAMRIRLSSLLALLPLALGACTAAMQGPEADLHAIATPTPVLEPVQRQPVPGPVVESGHFRAWIPAGTDESGARVDGHWITVPLSPPPEEVLVPVKPMPRAPHSRLGKTKPEGAAPAPSGDLIPGTPAPVRVFQRPPQALPIAQPVPVLPTGLTLPNMGP